ncbi:MAG: hypothetical protein A2Z03_05625 [Chloroflexi bacterium RBG_16_56_8]|nr:MAG: hypothetical protein A2Z03_05625 [Chloroflexi bacterium RBG_16_56_8]
MINQIIRMIEVYGNKSYKSRVELMKLRSAQGFVREWNTWGHFGPSLAYSTRRWLVRPETTVSNLTFLGIAAGIDGKAFPTEADIKTAFKTSNMLGHLVK